MRRPHLVLVVGLALVAAVATFAVKRSNGTSDEMIGPSLATEVKALTTAAGLIATPPTPGEGTLDGTAWAVLSQRIVGVDVVHPQASQVADLVEEGEPDPWHNLYSSVAASATAADERPSRSATRRATAPLHLSPIAGDPMSIADDALALWAEVTATRLADRSATAVDRVVRWTRSTLRHCRVNSFVAAHLLEVLTELQRPAWTTAEIKRCPAYTLAPSRISSPRNEEELLTLTGAALMLSHGLPPRADVMRQIRRALAPTTAMAYDAWWTYYALRGYVASGGAAADYEPTVRALAETADAHGLVPTPSQPVATLETTYLGVQLLTGTGVSVPSNVRRGAAALARHSSDWTDVDWATWGRLMHVLAVPPKPDERRAVLAAAARCGRQEATPENSAVVGLCRSTAADYGTVLADGVDWSHWTEAPPASVVISAESLRARPPADMLGAALAELRGDVEQLPTSVLVAMADLGQRAGFAQSAEDQRRLRRVLATRRAAPPFDAMFREFADDRAPNLHTTLAVVRWASENR